MTHDTYLNEISTKQMLNRAITSIREASYRKKSVICHGDSFHGRIVVMVYVNGLQRARLIFRAVISGFDAASDSNYLVVIDGCAFCRCRAF